MGKNELKAITTREKKAYGYISFMQEWKLEEDERARIRAINLDREERSFFGVKPQALILEEMQARREAE